MTESAWLGDRKVESLRMPPHSIQAEQSVLGGLMLDNQAWDTVADRVGEEDFYRKDHRLIFRAIRKLADEQTPFDAVTLSEWLEKAGELEASGGLAYLAVLAKETPSAANVGAYADIVRERSVLRQLIHVGTEVADSAYQPGGRGITQLLEEAEQKVFRIADQRQRGSVGFRPIKTLLSIAIDRIDTLFRSEGHITGVSTGFTDFDDMTSGLQSSDLIIVAGRPSMGKTTLAMNMAEHVAIKEKVPVAVFSMEMPGEQLAMRMMSSLGRIDQHRVRTGKLEDDEWPRMTSAINILADTELYIDDTAALTPTEVRARCRRLHREHGRLGLVVLDYLQLMQSPGSGDNRVAEISDISRSLKALAKELNVPVMALSQLNRNLEQRPNKRPVMSDLRECVTGDTLVCLTDGRRLPVRDLVGQRPQVWAMNGEWRLVPARAEQVWSVGSKPIRRVVLASGRTLHATAEHRVLTGTGWKTVSDLSIGDRMALARRLPEPESAHEWPDHRLVLLGHLVGDGSYLKHQPLRYTTSSEENSNAVCLAAEAMGSRVSRHSGRGRWHQIVIAGNGDRWHPAGVGKWLKELGIFGQRSHEKRLPQTVFGLSNVQVALLLRHLWATDGSITLRAMGQKGAARVYFSTASEGLAYDVAALLVRFGIVGRIRAVIQKSHRPVYTVDVMGAEQQRRFLEQIGAFGPRLDNAGRLAAELVDKAANTNVDTLPREAFGDVKARMAALGVSQRRMAVLRGTSYGGSGHYRFAPRREVMRTYAESLDSGELRRWADSDLFWDRVVDVQAGGEEEVFDLTVPGPACWLADGIVSHNSGSIEQDADLIVFIYRDEVYHPDTPDKGTAEIIIAKQRNGPIGTTRLTFLGQYTRFENFIADPYSDEGF